MPVHRVILFALGGESEDTTTDPRFLDAVMEKIKNRIGIIRAKLKKQKSPFEAIQTSVIEL